PRSATSRPPNTRPSTTLNTSPNRRLESTHRVSTDPGAVHGRPIVLVWDNDRRHLSAVMRVLIEARPWLTVFQLPAYALELNPAEGVWSALKRALANLAPRGIDELAEMVATKLKRMQYRSSLLDGFIAQTGFIFEPP
ncbi:transposase, partial [Streptosporangium canum]|uniref:transposase n=1 Tax=Streptosporangium canum TaxID=324952 RepID=UPI00344318E4